MLLSIIHAMIFMGCGIFGQSTSLFKDKNGTLHVSSENVDLPFAINNIGVLQTISALAKCMQSPCPPHHYRSGCEELMSKGNCIPCPPCPNHQYLSGCMLISAGICLNVTTCNVNQYEVRPPTSTNDRQCVALFSTTFTTTTTTTTSIASTSSPLLTTTTTTRKTPTTVTITKPQSTTTDTSSDTVTIPCSTIINTVLNCADPSSRAAITSKYICEVARVDNCCCDELSSLTRVSGDVNVHSNETMLHFGTIREVGGNITGRGPSTSNRGPLQVVDFGQITKVGGNVELWSNRITRVEFGVLARVDGWMALDRNEIASIDIGAITHIGHSLSFGSNSLTSIDFGTLTSIDGGLWLQDNDLTSIDFGTITHIGGGLSLYMNPLTSIDFDTITHIGGDLLVHDINDLTSIEFGAITHIGGWLELYNNPSLASIDCKNLGSCLCRSSNTIPTNCQSRCSWSTCA
eukprot:gene2648-biopygen4370